MTQPIRWLSSAARMSIISNTSPRRLVQLRSPRCGKGGHPDDYASDGFSAWLAAQQKGKANVRNGFPPSWHNDGEPVEELSCGEAESFVLTVNTGHQQEPQSLC